MHVAPIHHSHKRLTLSVLKHLSDYTSCYYPIPAQTWTACRKQGPAHHTTPAKEGETAVRVCDSFPLFCMTRRQSTGCHLNTIPTNCIFGLWSLAGIIIIIS